MLLFVAICTALLLPSHVDAVVLRCQYIDETTGEVVEDPAATTTPANDPETAETLSPVQLSELYPTPVAGQEEFIELYNPNASAISISGLKLTDASGKNFTISEATLESTSLAAHAYLTIPYSKTKIILNNSGDTIILTDEAGAILDQTTYGSALSGFSWSRHLSVTDPVTSWGFTSIVTQGTVNIFTETADDATETTTAQSTTTQTVPVGGAPSSPTTATIETPTVAADTHQTSSDIQINELLPNAVGSDTNAEWIELVNTGSDPVRLIDWTVGDAGKTYPIGDVTINAGELLLLESSKTHISLNNSGETVTLTDPFDAIIDSVAYGASTEGQSYARFHNGFYWTATPTPKSANILTKASVVETSTSNKKDDALKKAVAPNKNSTSVGSAKTSNSAQNQKTTIAAAKILEDGATVIISGTVTALPGQLGSQYFLLQDASGGVQVYSYAKLFPQLEIGTRVTVSGEVGTSRGTKRIKITQASDIVVNGSGDPVAAKTVSELNETNEGMLVQTASVLVEKSGLNWSLENGLAVGLKGSSGVSNKDFKEGDSVTVTGIVEQSGGNYRIAPRQAEDVKSGNDLTADGAGVAGNGTTTVKKDATGGGRSTAGDAGTKKAASEKSTESNESTMTTTTLLTKAKENPTMTTFIVALVIVGGLYLIRRNWETIEDQGWMKKLLENPRIAKVVEQLKLKGWLPQVAGAAPQTTSSLTFQNANQSRAITHSGTLVQDSMTDLPDIIDDAGVFYALSEHFGQRPS